MEKEKLIMINRCVFCGEPLNEQGVCPNMAQHFKPMCLNCVYCSTNSTDGECICLNEDNKSDAVQKIKASLDCGYEIVGLELAPLPLKEPSRKCKRHNLNTDVLVWKIEECGK